MSDETINLDEAPSAWRHRAIAAEAEVERLRAELAESTRQLDTCRRGSNNILDMSMGTQSKLGDAERKVAELEAENEALASRLVSKHNAETMTQLERDRLAKLEAENAELRQRQEFFDQNVCIIQDRDRELADLQEQLDALADYDKLKVRLAWFEEREQALRPMLQHGAGDQTIATARQKAIVFEIEHPKPEPTTGDVLTAEPGEWVIEGHTARRVGPKPE